MLIFTNTLAWPVIVSKFGIKFLHCALLFEVSSSPVDVPQIKYGCIVEKATKAAAWSWFDVSSSIFKCSEKVYLIFFY